jgi:hypothetical protein
VLGDRTRFRSDLRFGEEWLFYLEIARACRAGFVDEPLSIYHFQPGSLSRSDKHRNAVEFHRLLKAMRTTFPDLNTSRRRIVNRNIAELNRQLGCIAYREARFDAAVARFAEALRCAPTLRTVCHLGQSLWRRRRNQRRRSDSDFARDQVAPPAVR